jgi:hypothetical protein
MSTELTLAEIRECIYFIRGQRVMPDSDLARLYGVETKVLKRAVKRNLARFPSDFMFTLTVEEQEILRCQFGTSKSSRGSGGTRYAPFVFTQEGVAMLSGVLTSDRAIEVNVTIMRVFVKIREILDTNKELAKKIDGLERKFLEHDENFKAVFEAIRQLMAVGSPLTQKKIKGLNHK